MTSQLPTAPRAASDPARAQADARNGWTDAAVEVLKELWADGDLSAATIARRLGVTRNAVLGKVHRLGLSHRRTGPKPRAPRQPGPKLPGPRPAPGSRQSGLQERPSQSAPAPATDVGPGLVAHLEDIPRQGCHWPMGDPHAEDFRFCGRPAAVAPYCDGHRVLAYRPGGAKPAERLLRQVAG